MPFAAFNIVLDDGSETIPGVTKFSEDGWWLATKRCLRALYPGGFSDLRIADLACLEGGYAVEFARMGFGDVLGIEVRKSNFANCMYVKERVALPNLSFANDDVWNLERYGTFDVIFCGGILYHLDAPKRFIELMARGAQRSLLINTHFSTVAPIAAHNLSDLTENEGLPGRWYSEHRVRDEEAKLSSWGNARSFWIQREYLIQAIRDAGFALVLEQYDFLGDQIAEAMTTGYYVQQNRGMFVGVRA